MRVHGGFGCGDRTFRDRNANGKRYECGAFATPRLAIGFGGC
jgi:hypothetical protein